MVGAVTVGLAIAQVDRPLGLLIELGFMLGVLPGLIFSVLMFQQARKLAKESEPESPLAKLNP